MLKSYLGPVEGLLVIFVYTPLSCSSSIRFYINRQVGSKSQVNKTEYPQKNCHTKLYDLIHLSHRHNRYKGDNSYVFNQVMDDAEINIPNNSKPTKLIVRKRHN